MQKLLNKDSKILKSAVYVLILFLMIITGCSSDDDDEGVISVCNQDTDEFVVELRRDSDDSLVDSFQLGEWYDFDHCDEFDNIEKGNYYIAIYEEGSDEELRTDTFYLDGGEYEYFIIDDDGNIEKD